jgi:GNAT superfamily N-acetyltransferase
MIKIARASWKNTKDWSLAAWHKADASHYGHPVEYNDKDFRFKATEEGKIVGLIYGSYISGMIYIEGVITDEKERGKGIGKMLIEKVEEFGRKLGAHKTWLMTGEKWPENAFYQKLGFEQIARLPDFNHHQDFVIYTREIK